jgi:hypothetical protein
VGALAPQALRTFVTAFGFRNVLIVASAVTMVSAVLAYFFRAKRRYIAQWSRTIWLAQLAIDKRSLALALLFLSTSSIYPRS